MQATDRSNNRSLKEKGEKGGRAERSVDVQRKKGGKEVKNPKKREKKHTNI